MYNRPTNNETNIIRDIFSNSLKESFILSEAKGKGKGREKSREKGAERSSSKTDPLSQTEKTIEDALKQAEAEAPGVATPTAIPGVQQGKTTKDDLPQASDKPKRYASEPQRTGDMSNAMKATAAGAAGVMGAGTLFGTAVNMADEGQQPTEIDIPKLSTSIQTSQSLLDTAFKGRATSTTTAPAPSKPMPVVSGNETTNKTSKTTPIIPGSKSQIDKQLKSPSNAMKQLMDTIKTITSGTASPDTTKSTGMPGGLAPPPAMPPAGGNKPAVQPVAKPEQYFEAPPESDQEVYNYPGTLVGGKAKPEVQSKFDSGAPLEAPPEPDQVKPDKKLKSAPQPVVPQTPNIPEYKGGMKGDSGTQTGQFGASGLPPRPERKRIGSAVVRNEKGVEVTRDVYKNPETGELEVEDTPTTGPSQTTVAKGIPGEPRFGAHPPAGPIGGYAGQGLGDWAGNVLPPSSENPYLKPTPRPNPLSETYYNILSQRLDEEKSEPSGAQVNQAAYGYTARGGRNARKALASLQSGMWRGDSTSSGNIRAQTRTGRIDSNLQPSWGEKLKPHVITLMSAAQEHKIELSKEEAVNPGSKDHQRLLSMYPKDHDVHKASQAVGEIMRSRSNA